MPEPAPVTRTALPEKSFTRDLLNSQKLW